MEKNMTANPKSLSSTSHSVADDDASTDGLPEGVLTVLEGAPRTEEEAAPAAPVAPGAAFGNLGIAQVIDVRGSEVDIQIGGRIVTAHAAPMLHAAVLDTAMTTGEPVLVERGPQGAITVIGALRTRPAPGVDRMKEVTIEADHIHLRGRKEIVLSTAGVASIALRAAGEIETYADRIISRAEELHKIVGRMLRLN
jgi:hypothetical protein